MDSSQLNVPFTLHQVMKYTDGDGKVRTLIAEWHPFKGEENYFIDSLLYLDSLEMNENPQPEELDSSKEADIELEAEEECLWELNPLVIVGTCFDEDICEAFHLEL